MRCTEIVKVEKIGFNLDNGEARSKWGIEE